MHFEGTRRGESSDAEEVSQQSVMTSTSITLTVNGVERTVLASDVPAELVLLDYVRQHLELRGTKYMCREAGCGACIVTAVKTPGGTPLAVNSCMVPVMSCQGWEITTIEGLGDKNSGYHSCQKSVVKSNATQCGYCTPGMVMSMYSLIQSKKELKSLDIEKSFGSNICRCTGYRPIMEAFKRFATDSTDPIVDIEDLHICEKSGKSCAKANCLDSEWCLVSETDTTSDVMEEFVLKDGRYWYIAKEVQDIFDVLVKVGTDSYMLGFGNTSKGPYPVTDYPTCTIDISQIPELKGYTMGQNMIIGAGATLTEFMEYLETECTTEYFTYLSKLHEHMMYVAHIPVRNVGSLGGNLMMKHKNYFASDVYVLLATVGAEMTIRSLSLGDQVISMEEFLETDMVAKVIINIMLPPLSDEYKMQSYKVMTRGQSVHAVVNCGFLYKLDSDNVVQEARILYGSCSDDFNRATITEDYLVGKSLFTNETLQGALAVLETELVCEDAPPEPSADLKKQLGLRLFYKGLLSLCPSTILDSRYVSGAEKLHDSRPVSEGTQTYDTDSTLYPLNEPIPKIEAMLQASGEAVYCDDMPACPREVFAALVLTTVAVGEITAIDPTAALELPGVVAFYSAKDIVGQNSFTPDDHILYSALEEVFCSGQVTYYNQPYGAIVAETQHQADYAAAFVTATYKNVKTPVTDIKVARSDSTRNTLYTSADASAKGTDVSKVITGTNTVYGQYHFPMETIVCITKPTEEGLEVHSTTQWMNLVQLMVARALNIEESRIDVRVRRVGGAYGYKITRNILAAVACSLVAYKLNRPCRLIQSLSTNMRAFGKRLPCVADFEVGVSSTGVIQYNDVTLYEDNGLKINEDFYALAVDAVNNCYDATNWSYKCYNTITDTAKNTWCRAPGTLEFIANCEMIMERIACEMSLDPVAVRLANLNTSEYGDVSELYETLKTNADYDTRRTEVDTFNSENRWRKRGLRFSFLRWTPVSAGTYEVTMSVYHGDGSISITHGGIEMGQGINTKVVQVVSYLLGVPMDQIHVKCADTNVTPNVFVTGGSLASEKICIAAAKCCATLNTRLETVKASLDNPTWADIAKAAYEAYVDLHVRGIYSATENVTYNVYGAALAEVEIDVLTGELEVCRVDLMQDVGQSISPLIDIGQIEGAFVMGLGYWTCEKMVYDTDSGELLSNRAWSYHVPQVRDIPQKLNVYFRTKSYGTSVTYGSKCVGEPPICMSVVVPLAIREALMSARAESGTSSTEWFDIDGPYNVETIATSALTTTEQLKFY